MASSYDSRPSSSRGSGGGGAWDTAEGCCHRNSGGIGFCTIFLGMSLLMSGIIIAVHGYELHYFKEDVPLGNFLKYGGVLFVCAGFAAIGIGFAYYAVLRHRWKKDAELARVSRRLDLSVIEQVETGNRATAAAATQEPSGAANLTSLFQTSSQFGGLQRDEERERRQNELFFGRRQSETAGVSQLLSSSGSQATPTRQDTTSLFTTSRSAANEATPINITTTATRNAAPQSEGNETSSTANASGKKLDMLFEKPKSDSEPTKLESRFLASSYKKPAAPKKLPPITKSGTKDLKGLFVTSQYNSGDGF